MRKRFSFHVVVDVDVDEFNIHIDEELDRRDDIKRYIRRTLSNNFNYDAQGCVLSKLKLVDQVQIRDEETAATWNTRKGA